MILKFHVDQNTAIRRGFDSNSTVKLQVPIPELTQEQRNFLASHFWKGSVMAVPTDGRPDEENSRGRFLTIKEPTLNGVLEAIAEGAK